MRLTRAIPLVLIMLLAAVQAAAQTALTAEEFDDYTRGKTLYYGFEGAPYGVERYLDGRRVIWSFLDGNCKNGVWYEANGQICFIYEDQLDPQCWTFSDGPNGLTAQFENDPEQIELNEAQDTGEKMLCYGPEVGV